MRKKNGVPNMVTCLFRNCFSNL